MKGNCIDKFIEKKVSSSIINILKYRLSLRRRIDNRTDNNDYFSSLCYEQDFSDIRKIKEEATKLIEDCNKFLERISEQYSKLN